MIFRRISIVAIAVSCVLSVAHASPNDTRSSSSLEKSAPPVEASLSAYRQYVKAQADTLVGMTRVLASAIKHGDLDTSQLTYVPAHRYLKRIEPIARALHELNKSMDARADAYGKREVDPGLSGFHRIEYGLFANRSTKDLAVHADRLNRDARELRDRLALLDATPAALVDGTLRTLADIADNGLTGNEERYSRTDLWDVEANIDGARQVVSILQSQPRAQNAKILASTEIHFAKINELLEKHKAGCGFKNFDEISQEDRSALKAPIMALAEALSTLRGTLAMD